MCGSEIAACLAGGVAAVERGQMMNRTCLGLIFFFKAISSFYTLLARFLHILSHTLKNVASACLILTCLSDHFSRSENFSCCPKNNKSTMVLQDRHISDSCREREREFIVFNPGSAM